MPETDQRRLTMEIRASGFPGSTCGPAPDGAQYEDIHVGLAHRSDTIGLVRGDARQARWSFDVTVSRDVAGQLDLHGPNVYGARGDRSIGLRWVTLSDDDELLVFRAAKLRFRDIDAALIERAIAVQRRLVARIRMTDEHGHPICATVRSPYVAWSVD
jgi:hypothetical protein